MDTKEVREKLLDLQREKRSGDKIQLFFDQKIKVPGGRRYRGEEQLADTMTVGTFFMSTAGSFCWSSRSSRVRSGMYVPHEILTHITDAKILKSKPASGLANFLNKFDPCFATIGFIEDIYRECCFDYNDKTKEINWISRFRSISPTGRRVMERFLVKFTNVYQQQDKVYEFHKTRGAGGRDISISF